MRTLRWSWKAQGLDSAARRATLSCWHVVPCLALRRAPACCAAMRNLRHSGSNHCGWTPEKVASTPAPADGQQEQPPTGNTADDARKQQIASECADLLKMATDLKTEVDKTTKDTLSVTVVRKAGEIEQLAHKVRTGSPQGLRRKRCNLLPGRFTMHETGRAFRNRRISCRAVCASAGWDWRFCCLCLRWCARCRAVRSRPGSNGDQGQGIAVMRPTRPDISPFPTDDRTLMVERRMRALNIERQKQMVADADKLLKLARELNDRGRRGKYGHIDSGRIA